YLPRLFVYHCTAAPGSELSETLKVMERRLLRAIINPAMIATWVFGGLMLWANPGLLHFGWMHIKLTAVLLLQVVHAMLARHRKQFAADANVHSDKYYRVLNEVPTVLLIVIVIMVIVQPSF
ncbi:MAG: protoporphyrinogen oxidase HemJ, partial [Alphaproteobacteria bacterium]|nr:protoporphyrinogen oxidase HemJ [Alphaproteobacteria bacterium]